MTTARDLANAIEGAVRAATMPLCGAGRSDADWTTEIKGRFVKLDDISASQFARAALDPREVIHTLGNGSTMLAGWPMIPR